MKVSLKIIASCVPAVCIALGFLAVFGLKNTSGWWLILLGAVLQVLYIYFNRRQR